MINDLCCTISGSDKIIVDHTDSYNLGARATTAGWNFLYACEADRLGLLIYEISECRRAAAEGVRPEPLYSVYVDSSYKTGNVFAFNVRGVKLGGLAYCFDDEGSYETDAYAERVLRLEGMDGSEIFYGVLESGRYDWSGDVSLNIPHEDLIIYKLHVRGYTKNRFSKVSDKGTFKALAAKIPYIKELGVTAVELMPAYEFVNSGANTNFWGYDGGFYMAPRGAYSASYGKHGDYTYEFRDTIKQFHKNGIEVYMEMFFPHGTGSGYIDDCVRYWRREYHIDGVHLICDDNAAGIPADDVFLKGMKIFSTNWDNYGRNDDLYEYNNGFLESARRIIKGDEDQLQGFLYMMRKNTPGRPSVNYIASNDGFTLADVYSYDRKHNEANGENNRDGANYNLSWNCGVEGPTKRRKVVELRNLLMRDAITFVMCAQGIPLIYAGDEFGNSQGGNNNAYCQDNDTGWVDWNALNRNHRFYDFVRTMIDFRKHHACLHMADEAGLTDYKYYGLPDVSYHGVKAWYPELEHYSRQAGIMYCGQYAGDENNLYIAFNMHWEPHELALPNISGRSWQAVLTTGTEGLPDASQINEARTVSVPARTIIILEDEKNS